MVPKDTLKNGVTKKWGSKTLLATYPIHVFKVK